MPSLRELEDATNVDADSKEVRPEFRAALDSITDPVHQEAFKELLRLNYIVSSMAEGAMLLLRHLDGDHVGEDVCEATVDVTKLHAAMSAVCTVKLGRVMGMLAPGSAIPTLVDKVLE